MKVAVSNSAVSCLTKFDSLSTFCDYDLIESRKESPDLDICPQQQV